MEQLDVLVHIAHDIAAARNSRDRHRRLLDAMRRVLPYDAATLLRRDDDVLVPLAATGLAEGALGRRYPVHEHPRLDIICQAEGPFRFPKNTQLPDPFDGLIAADPTATQRVHACLGVPLRVHGSLVGALTADAFDPDAFDAIDERFLTAVGALAASEVHTTELIAALERTAERQGRIVRDLLAESRESDRIVGFGAAMARLREEIELVGRSGLGVLITGETGVGKELVARGVHRASARSHLPLIYVNCAALPEALAEAELFGHARGAFTGATADRAGRFELADGGTLFLDEVGELPLAVQPKLLRALQEGEIQRIGADRTIRVDVRLVAATNRDLEAEVAAGRFRADLFHRLAVFPLHVPPLRDRRDDIPTLAGHFCDRSRRRLGTGPVRLTAGALDALAVAPWPGNVRELDNVISRAVLRASAGVPRGEAVVVTRGHLELGSAGAPVAPSAVEIATALGQDLPLSEAVRVFQRLRVQRALHECGGNLAAAARALGMDRSNLHHLAKRLDLR